MAWRCLAVPGGHPGGVQSQDVLGLHFFITALDPSDGSSWVKKKSELPEWTLAVERGRGVLPRSLRLAPLDHAGEKTIEVMSGLLVTSDRH